MRLNMLTAVFDWVMVMEDDVYPLHTDLARLFDALLSQLEAPMHVIYWFAQSPQLWTPRQVFASCRNQGQTYDLVRIKHAYGMQCIMMHKEARDD